MNHDLILREVEIRTSRSGGAGGQHVNKVESKVEVRFDINATEAFEEHIKQNLLAAFQQTHGLILVTDQTSRSQHQNKELALKKLFHILQKALVVRKKRKVTRVPLGVTLKRKADKRQRSEVKMMRRKPIDL